jgi:hypothetical protein
MLGGLFAVIIVGAILEKGDLYAKLASESYIRSADDEEFYKNMSEEEKRTAQAILSKTKENEQARIMGDAALKDLSLFDDEQTTITIAEALPKTQKEATKASSDIFSDYGD